MTVPALTLADAEHALEAQPFSVLLGTRMVSFSAGAACLALTIRPDLLQQFGFVHGGVVSYLADNTLTMAGGSVLGSEVVTAGYSIDMLSPATSGQLVAEATVVSSSSRRATCRADVLLEDGTSSRTLVAVAQGTIVALGNR